MNNQNQNQNPEQEQERVITPQETSNDQNLDLTLRPKTLQEFIGQLKIKESLNIFIQAAQKRNEALEHTLLYGSPGCLVVKFLGFLVFLVLLTIFI